MSWIVELWLSSDVQAREEFQDLQKIRSIIRVQPQLHPHPLVYSRIAAAIKTKTVRPTVAWRPTLVWAPIVAILIFSAITILRVAPPGLVVQWSVEGELPVTFRILRAPAEEADDFTVIGELDAESGVVEYGFTDLRLIPGQVFQYRVEALSPTGQLTTSQAMVGNTLDALPGQLLLVLTFMVAALGIIALFNHLRSSQWKDGRLALL